MALYPGDLTMSWKIGYQDDYKSNFTIPNQGDVVRRTGRVRIKCHLNRVPTVPANKRPAATLFLRIAAGVLLNPTICTDMPKTSSA